MNKLVLSSVAVLAMASFAQAGIVFSDNFDAENGGTGVVDYGAFSNWTVDNGYVDLIGNGYFDFLPGNGLYVDMDGSRNDAGRMTSTTLNLAAGTYYLSFELAGNHRNNNAESVDVSVQVGAFSESFSLAQNAPFTSYTRSFTLASAQSVNIVFEGAGGDRIGMLLDDVVLRDSAAAVPLPPAAWMGLVGLGALGLVRRRRRRA